MAHTGRSKDPVFKGYVSYFQGPEHMWIILIHLFFTPSGIMRILAILAHQKRLYQHTNRIDLEIVVKSNVLLLSLMISIDTPIFFIYRQGHIPKEKTDSRGECKNMLKG
jgi:hypothetical protein